MSIPTPPDPLDTGDEPSAAPDSPEGMSHGAHGRYGIEEEPIEPPAAETPPIPKTPDEIARDAARDEEVKNTGEDLG